MKNRFILVVGIVLGIFFSSTVFADYTASQWKYKKAVSGITLQQSGSYVKAYLDREVSMHANMTLSDLRVLEDGMETPYQLVTLSDSVRSDYVPSTLRDLSNRDSNTMFIIDLGASGVLSDHLRILSETKNFKKIVSVSASDVPLAIDDQKWRILTDTGYIYNFNDSVSGFNAGSGDVSYPSTSSRYLKVVISDTAGTHITVSGAEVFRVLRKESEENVIRTSAVVKNNAEQKTTEITADLGGVGIPTHRITLNTRNVSNFSRRALVLASDDGVTWSSIGGGYLSSLATPSYSGSALTLSYEEVRSRYVRVLVMNQDDVPVSWDEQVSIESTARAVVFMVHAGKEYVLMYGNTLAHMPNYDLARYFQYIESTLLGKVVLAPQEDNLEYISPLPAQVPLSENHPNLLNAILVIMVALLSFFLIAHVKKLKNLPRGNNQ